jgi:hypothetical protein
VQFLGEGVAATSPPYPTPGWATTQVYPARCRKLILFIKAWTESEGKKDQEILAAALNSQPRWPWSTTGDFAGRLAEASERRTHREGRKRAQDREVR